MKLAFKHRAPRKIHLILIHHQSENTSFHYVCISEHTGAQEPVAFNSIEEIIKKAGKNNPYVIHVRGAGILARSVENAPNFRERLLVSGREDEFYFNSYERSGSILVSFARKHVIDQFLEPIEAVKGFIWSLYIGPAVLPFKTDGQSSVQADYHVSFPSESSVNISKSEVLLSENQITKAYLDSISNHVFQKGASETVFHQAIDEKKISQTKSEYADFKQFKIIGLSILSFFLVALTANYFIVNHLNQVAADYEMEIAGYQDNFAIIDRTRQEQQRKQVLFQNSGIQSGHLLSYYADDIGTTVPKDIQFTTMELFPLVQPLKPKHKVETDQSAIIIKGITLNSRILDDWMEDLEKKDWIKSVEVINYSRLDNQNSIFHIIIHIRE